MADFDALKIEVRVRFTPKSAALLRAILAAIRAGDRYEFDDLLQRLEEIEPLLEVVD